MHVDHYIEYANKVFFSMNMLRSLYFHLLNSPTDDDLLQYITDNNVCDV